jgi:hypothetical protein
MPRRNGNKRISYNNRGKDRNKKKRDSSEESNMFQMQERDTTRY